MAGKVNQFMGLQDINFRIRARQWIRTYVRKLAVALLVVYCLLWLAQVVLVH